MKTTLKNIVLIIVYMIIGTSIYSQDIYQAVKDGNTEQVKNLLLKSPDLLNAKNQDALTPLNLAAQEKQYEVAKFLSGKRCRSSIGG